MVANHAVRPISAQGSTAWGRRLIAAEYCRQRVSLSHSTWQRTQRAKNEWAACRTPRRNTKPDHKVRSLVLKPRVGWDLLRCGATRSSGHGEGSYYGISETR
jgi:hypothetical protein